MIKNIENAENFSIDQTWITEEDGGKMKEENFYV